MLDHSEVCSMRAFRRQNNETKTCTSGPGQLICSRKITCVHVCVPPLVPVILCGTPTLYSLEGSNK